MVFKRFSALRSLVMLALLVLLQAVSFAPAYAQSAPTISNVTPSGGPVAGGTQVVITGTNFTNVVAVRFVGFDAAIFTVDSPTQITAVTRPANTAQTGSVQVETSNGTVTRLSAFAYRGPPTLTAPQITPDEGPTAGGTQVTLEGVDLFDAVVTFGGVNAAIVSNNGTRLVVTTPPGNAGAQTVRVTTVGGSDTTTFT